MTIVGPGKTKGMARCSQEDMQKYHYHNIWACLRLWPLLL